MWILAWGTAVDLIQTSNTLITNSSLPSSSIVLLLESLLFEMLVGRLGSLKALPTRQPSPQTYTAVSEDSCGHKLKLDMVWFACQSCSFYILAVIVDCVCAILSLAFVPFWIRCGMIGKQWLPHFLCLSPLV